MKLMFNEDWTHYCMTRYENNVNVDENELKKFIYQYKDTQITDFAINVNGSVSTYPSKTRQSFCDKYIATHECGIEVDYKDTFAKKAYEIFIEKNLDMYKIWIDTLREIGIKPWISIRVNDCHGNGKDPELRQSEYIISHPEHRRIRHRVADEYFDFCLDFELEEVRANLLAYIEETLERYRPDGLELDFSREAHLFVPGREQKGRECVNDMMRKIKALTKKYAPKDKKMLINVIINGSAQTNLEMGLDPAFWAKEGLIDSLVNISRWDTTNTALEIELWKKLIDGKVKLGLGHQILAKPTVSSPYVIASEEIAFGQACANLYNGGDFVYLYNYMDICEETGLDFWNHSTSLKQPDRLKKILKNIGDYETASRQKRIHILTFDDFLPDWKPITSRLPIKFEKNTRQFIKILTGGVRKEEKAQVVLGFDKKLCGDDIEVFVNSVPTKFVGNGGLDENLTKSIGCVFDIDDNSEIGGNTIIEIKLFKEAVLEFSQISISE